MMKMENEINVTVPLEVVKASEIEPKEVKWLWYPYIPFGKVTLLQGDPGDGKSKLMLSIAALLSKGEALPFTDEEVEPMTIIYQTTEDDADDTVVPRFNSAGGNGENLIFIKEDEKSLSFGDNRIAEAIEKYHASADLFLKRYTDIQFEQYEQLNKEVPQFDEHFVEQIKQLDGIKNIDVQKTVWAGIDFNENDLEGFMKIKYEDSKYKAKGQSYEQTIETLKGYAESGDYGCYITTLPDDRVLEEYNAEHPDTPIDMEAFKRGETAIAGKDTEYNAPNTALVGETLTLTADSTDGKATDFKIGGAFYYDDYDNTLSEGIGRRKEINMVPDVIFVSEAGMERLTKEPIISAIGVDIKNFND